MDICRWFCCNINGMRKFANVCIPSALGTVSTKEPRESAKSHGFACQPLLPSSVEQKGKGRLRAQGKQSVNTHSQARAQVLLLRQASSRSNSTHVCYPSLAARTMRPSVPCGTLELAWQQSSHVSTCRQ